MAFGFDFLGDPFSAVASTVVGAAAKTVLGQGRGSQITSQMGKQQIQRVPVDKMGYYSTEVNPSRSKPADVTDPSYLTNMWINRMRMFANTKG
jgi:hypothetical protein